MMTHTNIEPGRPLDQAVGWAYSRPGFEPISALFRAVQAHRIGLTIIFSRRFLWTPRRLLSSIPRVLLIADDAGDSRDPDEWRCTISAIAWARAALVHGTGGRVVHYCEAVTAAETTGRCLMVETDSTHAAAWMAAIWPRAIPALMLIPPPGRRHPAVSP